MFIPQREVNVTMQTKLSTQAANPVIPFISCRHAVCQTEKPKVSEDGETARQKWQETSRLERANATAGAQGLSNASRKRQRVGEENERGVQDLTFMHRHSLFSADRDDSNRRPILHDGPFALTDVYHSFHKTVSVRDEGV